MIPGTGTYYRRTHSNRVNELIWLGLGVREFSFQRISVAPGGSAFPVKHRQERPFWRDGEESKFASGILPRQHVEVRRRGTMTSFPIGSPDASQRASRNGPFDQVPDDELRSPPMCGQAVITKILGKSPGRQHQVAPLLHAESNRGTRSCISISASKKISTFRNLRYEEVGGSQRSPDTESSSSSEREDPEETPIMQPIESLPSYIVQFEPQELKVLQEEKLRESSVNKVQRQRSPMTPFSRTSIRTTPLAPVTEERSFELEDKSQASQSQASRDAAEKSISGATEPAEKSDKVAAMRKLVIKQQKALQELSEQNSQYRREVGESKSKLSKMQKESSRQQARIDKLVIDKEALLSECVWLREEMKVLRRIALEPTRDDERLRRKFERLMELEVASEASSSYAGDSDIDVHGIFKKALMSSKESDCIPTSPKRTSNPKARPQSRGEANESQQKYHTLMRIGSSSSDNDAPFDEEDKSEIEAFQNLKKSIEADESLNAFMKDTRRPETREDTVSRTSSRFETRDESEEHIAMPSKANTKEEVTLFKERLETLQKKRVKRHLERNRSGTKVRFR